ncbi:MAG: hypothetical protein IKR28_02065 [Selenomonadaceae bacterium]|nr:hypothetical protein [Selenomonadaceae bacterium]
MLGFGRKKRPDPDASQLLATILVIYNMISTVSYDPEDGMIRLSFALKGQPSEGDFKEFAAKSVDSIEAYHHLEGFVNTRVEMYMEGVGETYFLHVKRDMKTLSRGEISILTTLVEESFSNFLIIDDIGDTADADFILMQEDRLDQMLGMARQMTIPDRLVGIREQERVVVYAK